MNIRRKIDVPIWRGDFEEKYLSKNIIDLFLRNHKRLFYYMNKKSEKHAGR